MITHGGADQAVTAWPGRWTLQLRTSVRQEFQTVPRRQERGDLTLEGTAEPRDQRCAIKSDRYMSGDIVQSDPDMLIVVDAAGKAEAAREPDLALEIGESDVAELSGRNKAARRRGLSAVSDRLAIPGTVQADAVGIHATRGGQRPCPLPDGPKKGGPNP